MDKPPDKIRLGTTGARAAPATIVADRGRAGVDMRKGTTMRWRWVLGALALLPVGCGASSTTVVTVPPGTPTPNAVATAPRPADLTHPATAPARPPAPPATARHANTPVPSPSAAPANPTAALTGALKVAEQAFGQNERGIGFAFVVENTDPTM